MLLSSEVHDWHDRTLILEEAILWIGIDLLGIESMIVKIARPIAVIIGYYMISKWVVIK